MSAPFRVVALLAVFNEEDILPLAIADLIAQGVEVYLIDNWSTDRSLELSLKYEGHGLIGWEKYPPEKTQDTYPWEELLKRKAEVAHQIQADWYLHCDADEFRESPWRDMKLREALSFVDSLGYNAINFDLIDFCLDSMEKRTDTDIRSVMTRYKPGQHFNHLQVKGWKRQAKTVDLHSKGGHHVLFEKQRIFPLPFLLRHYPLRSIQQAQKKIFSDRKGRFLEKETKRGWHTQYNEYQHEADLDIAKLCVDSLVYEPLSYRLDILERISREILYLHAVRESRVLESSVVLHAQLDAFLGGNLDAPEKTGVWKRLLALDRAFRNNGCIRDLPGNSSEARLYVFSRGFVPYAWLDGQMQTEDQVWPALKTFLNLLRSVKRLKWEEGLLRQVLKKSDISELLRIKLLLRFVDLRLLQSHRVPMSAVQELNRLTVASDDLDKGVLYTYASLLQRCSLLDEAYRIFAEITGGRMFHDLCGGAFFHLGEIDMVLSRYAAAKANFLHCLELIPNHNKAQVLLNELGDW